MKMPSCVCYAAGPRIFSWPSFLFLFFEVHGTKKGEKSEVIHLQYLPWEYKRSAKKKAHILAGMSKWTSLANLVIHQAASLNCDLPLAGISITQEIPALMLSGRTDARTPFVKVMTTNSARTRWVKKSFLNKEIFFNNIQLMSCVL